jgi:integrase
MPDNDNALIVVEMPEEYPPEMVMVVQAVLDGLSEGSRRMYRQSIDQFLAWLREYPGQAVNKGTIAAYKRYLEEDRALAPSTVNRHLSAVRKLIGEAADHGMFDESTLAAIKRVKGAKMRGQRYGNWLTRDQAQALLNAPDPTTLKGARDQAILALLLGCGLRRNELVGLVYNHLQAREGHWALVDLRGKGGRVRTVKVPPWAKRAIDNWTEMSGREVGPEDRIFVSVDKVGRVRRDGMTAQAIYYLVRDYCREADIPELSPHDLRRTFAKLARKGGAQLEQLQLTLGHASATTTERYVGATLDLDDNAVDYTGLRASGKAE